MVCEGFEVVGSNHTTYLKGLGATRGEDVIHAAIGYLVGFHNSVAHCRRLHLQA
jgi:hypothetical protein